MSQNDYDYDTTEKVERTDHGYRLTVESTRGTSVRDQDSAKAELRSESRPSVTDVVDLTQDVKQVLGELRDFQPDETEDSDE